MVSIGTGIAATEQIDPRTVDTVTWLENLGTFLTTTEQFTHEYLLSHLAKDYYRFQADLAENIGLDAISPYDIQLLKDAGATVVATRQPEIQ
jgi:hypothetical protein